jgi:hypothetical protein
MDSFSATLEIIGINPFVFVPEKILQSIFDKAGKDKGAIPVCGKVNGKDYTQTLVRYAGEWRLYINTLMLKDSPKRIGETLDISIDFDPKPRTVLMPSKWKKALKENPDAKKVFDRLSASRQKEINRYIGNLKTDGSIERNVAKAIAHLRAAPSRELVVQERWQGKFKD